MPPRKSSTKRKKSLRLSATTPTPVDDHELPIPEVKTEAELADVAKAKTKETLGQVEASNPNPAEIGGDSATGGVVSSELVIKEEVILENSAVVDMNEAGGDKAKEDLRVGCEDVNKGKQGVGVRTNEDGVISLEKDEQDETIGKEKEHLQQGSKNVDEEKQGAGVEKDDNGVVGIDASKLETNSIAEINSAKEEMTDVQVDDSKQLNDNDNPLVGNGHKKGTAEIVSTKDSAQAVSTKESCENNPALVIEDDEESEEGSEGDDSDNEDIQDPLPDNKKDKDIEIYVGGLDKDTVEDDLINVFQQFGELKSTRIVRNSTTKKSKGFAFVRFVSVDQANHALSELKDGVEVKGKRVKISASQDNHTLYLGNISKTWKQEEVSQQLKDYGIEHIEMIRLPEDPKNVGKIKGFAFLEFNAHSDAVAAFQKLRKPDAIFGRDVSAKVAFAQAPINPSDEDLSQVKRVYLEGLPKDWNEEKTKDICKKYGEIVKIDLCQKAQNSKTKHKDFGFVTFASHESALACVEGINNAGIGGEVKIKANIAKPHSKNRSQKQGFRGGFKVEKGGDVATSNKKGGKSKETLLPKSLKKKGVVNSPQAKKNKKDSTFKNKIKATIAKPQQKGIIINGESSKKPELLKVKDESNSQQAKRKRKADAPPNFRHGDQVTPKKPKNVNEGQNSKSASKPGSNKRKKFGGREDVGNRNNNNKKPFKKQKGNMHGRERVNFRNPKSDAHVSRGHDDYRNSTRYVEPYIPQYPAHDTYRLAPDTRRYKEMEPHAGYIEPTSARPYSSYVQPVVRTHNHHQTIYLEPGSGSQSQLHSRYLDRPVMTQSHRGYIETSEPYRGYQHSSVAQIARDPYDSGLSRSVRHDGRDSGVLSYGGGPPPVSSSQARNYTSYYQGGGSGSYSGGYGSQRTYY